jgi:hypothetical protein
MVLTLMMLSIGEFNQITGFGLVGILREENLNND